MASEEASRRVCTDHLRSLHCSHVHVFQQESTNNGGEPQPLPGLSYERPQICSILFRCMFKCSVLNGSSCSCAIPSPAIPAWHLLHLAGGHRSHVHHCCPRQVLEASHQVHAVFLMPPRCKME